MITQLTLRNFKSVSEQVYQFTDFDLLVGRNNSGKSTVLQSLAIWQFCVDEFHRAQRSGSTGIQIVLPNFTALPVPEFNLLWKDRTDRAYPLDAKTGKKKQTFILIEILLEWRQPDGSRQSLGVELRYHSRKRCTPFRSAAGKPLKNAKPKAARVPYRALPTCHLFRAWSRQKNGWTKRPSASK